MYYMAQGATMEGAEAMSALRNTLKAVFRLNPWTKFRVYSFAEVVAKYGTAEAIIAAAGRTSTKFNVLGALAAIGSTKELASKEKCKCR